MPSMNCFWKMMYRMIMDMQEISAAIISSGYFWACCSRPARRVLQFLGKGHVGLTAQEGAEGGDKTL